MDRLSNSVYKATISVWRQVDNQLSAGRGGSRYFKVQRVFARCSARGRV